MIDVDLLDLESLRRDLKSYLEGSYFVMGFGAALIEAGEIDEMDAQELVLFATKNGFNLQDYVINNKQLIL